jgi:glycosyltransferase involved in cell wall biosynthesis
MTLHTTLVVPCYDEAERLDEPGLLSLLEESELELLFVNDGSTDGTSVRLHELASKAPDRIAVLELPENVGKAEAVRQGLLQALAKGADLVGYIDADLATPPSEVRRLVRVMREGEACALLASRIALLGHSIERSALRHVLGRAFATAASLILELDVYDTQCGAKIFRRGAPLLSALEEPFRSRWAFDVELLGRLLAGAPGVSGLPPALVREEPLLAWRDVPGSKLKPAQMLATVADLAIIRRDLARRRG